MTTKRFIVQGGLGEYRCSVHVQCETEDNAIEAWKARFPEQNPGIWGVRAICLELLSGDALWRHEKVWRGNGWSYDSGWNSRPPMGGKFYD